MKNDPLKMPRSSKSQPAQSCGRNSTKRLSISPMVLKFKQLFPDYTAAELMKRTGASFSHCEKVIAGKRELGGKFEQALLRSDVGREMLAAIMVGSKQPWWTAHQKQLELADVLRQQAQLARQIERIQREIAE